MENLSRNKMRELIISCLFAANIKTSIGLDVSAKKTIDDIFAQENIEEIPLFCQEIFLAALKNKEEIISQVSSYLRNWKFNRLNEVAQALFLEVIAEHSYSVYKTEKKVLINFAVDYAKKYLESSDFRYINAVLDKVIL